jgi:protoheme IX farnesyltransferase
MQEQRSRGGTLAAIIELSKIRITVAVTLSTLAGYILFAGTIDLTAVWASLGVFLLASSSAALNQYQERKIDAMMTRTSRRPIPSGRISVSLAFIVVVVVFLAGSGILFFKTNEYALGLGLISFFWYNAIYTPLKYKTVFALIIGSVIGALPPVIGWTAAGGDIFATPILFLAFFIYVWQVPHFILLLLLYGNDYKEAGLPVLTTYYDEFSVRRIIFVWILGTMIAGLMLPFMCGMQYWVSAILMILLSAGLCVSMIRLIIKNRPFRVKRAFILMNVYLVLVLILISVDKLL